MVTRLTSRSIPKLGSIVTAAAITPANARDGPAGVMLLANEEPSMQVLADSAYGGSDTRALLRAAGHDQAIKPLPLQRAVPGGFNRVDYIVDHDARTTTCPAGHTVAIATEGTATFGVRCRGCPLRERCTTAKGGRVLKIGGHSTIAFTADRYGVVLSERFAAVTDAMQKHYGAADA